MNQDNKKNTILFFFLWGALFAFLFVFFFFLHPQVVLDYDDWAYVAYSRIPLPWPGFWNPSRVLPECFMPVCGGIGGLINSLVPSIGYIRSLSLVFAIVLSIFIFLYVFILSRFIEKRFAASKIRAFLVSVFFLILHFIIFRTAPEKNEYLFKTANVTCCFFYLIPVLLNCILVLWFASEKNGFVYSFLSDGLMIKKLFVLFILYFAVFSNLFASIIIAVYSACCILFDSFLKKEKSFIHILKNEFLFLLILVLWCISAVFEAFGGRASGSFSGKTSFIPQLKRTFSLFVQSLKNFNLLFLLVTAFVILLAVLILAKLKNEKKVSYNEYLIAIVHFLFCTVFVFVFVLLLCAKVSPIYILRPDVVISFYSLFFILICVLLTCIMKYFHGSTIAVAAVCTVMICSACTKDSTFSESYSIDIDLKPQVCTAVSQDLVNQAVAADENGQSEMALEVMMTIDLGTSNWPQCTYMGDVFMNAMVKHKVVDHAIKVSSVTPSEEFNQRYGLDFSPVIEMILNNETE